MGKNETKALGEVTNGAKHAIAAGEPYMVTATIQGTADMLFHRWNCEAVEAKGKAAKNSAIGVGDFRPTFGRFQVVGFSA